MPINFTIRSLASYSLFFAIFMPLINEVIEVFSGDTGTILFWIPVGAVVGLIFGAMQLAEHYKQINVLADEVNEETVKPIREFELLLDEKLDPAMDTLKARLDKKDWKLKSENREEATITFSVNKHRGWPYRFLLKLYPRRDGCTLLQVFIKSPFLDDYLPDLGKSLRYCKEFKSVLL